MIPDEKLLLLLLLWNLQALAFCLVLYLMQHPLMRSRWSVLTPRFPLFKNSPDVWLNYLAELESVEERVDDYWFRKQFRMNYSTFTNLYDEILPFYEENEHRKRRAGGRPQLPLQIQLLVLLQRLGDLSSVTTVASLLGVSTGEVTVICDRLVDLINLHLRDRYVHWPNPAERSQLAQQGCNEGRNRGQFCGVVGAIDGSHIELSPTVVPEEQQKDYVNRKGWCSIILLAVVDLNLRFRYLSIGLPGSQHDATALAQSLFPAYSQFIFNPGQYLLGDTAFPLQKWLITPFRDNGHLSDHHHLFNSVLSSMRVMVEQSFGHLKERFRHLTRLNVNLDRAEHYVSAACVLHNFCIVNSDPQFQTEVELDEEAPDDDFINDSADGSQVREQILSKFR